VGRVLDKLGWRTEVPSVRRMVATTHAMGWHRTTKVGP
jgi:hypothetical protein